MPRLFTLAQLRDRVRQLADVETARAPADPEINSVISSAYAKYYNKLVKAGIGYPTETTQTITSTGVDSYALNADHFATLRVDLQYQAGYWAELEEIDIRQVADYQFPGATYAVAYRLAGGNLVLLPTPATGTIYRHIYAPAPSDLTSDAQNVDGVAGWEDAIVLEAAIRLLMKAGEDVAALMAERKMVDDRIDEEAEMRSLTHSRKIVCRTSWSTDGRLRDPSDWPYWLRSGE